MSKQTKIHRELAKQLAPMQELALIRTAFARAPALVLRAKLAGLLLLCDRFDEVIALLSGADDARFEELVVLAEAYLARERHHDSRQARTVADRAFACAKSDAARAAALALRGKAEIRLGNLRAARATLEQALDHDPRNKDACKRIVAIDLERDPAAVLAMTDRLGAKGAAHANLFAARALAFARGGDVEAAREAIGLDDFQHCETLAPPPGWASIQAFNAALADELLAHPGLRYERFGTASEESWRIDAPAIGEAPLAGLLLDAIAAALGRQVQRIAAADHPWAAARPAEAMLRSGCVITDGEGFETWHVHQFGWLSGSYYVRVPDSIANGTDRGGCLEFGLPEALAGAEAAAAHGAPLVRPSEGLLLTFPSHAYHRTYPHCSRETRICLAFDLRPS